MILLNQTLFESIYFRECVLYSSFDIPKTEMTLSLLFILKCYRDIGIVYDMVVFSIKKGRDVVSVSRTRERALYLVYVVYMYYRFQYTSGYGDHEYGPFSKS